MKRKYLTSSYGTNMVENLVYRVNPAINVALVFVHTVDIRLRTC